MAQHPYRVTAAGAAALAVFVCLLSFGQSASLAAVPQRPNIVLIFADDKCDASGAITAKGTEIPGRTA
ncbi:MAG: hypothetical protein H6822_12610 [Planctomycetaceae bacterium]|nr:hypothetical protein [Planctomycetales bacterium]MCB9923018.1 hypothetical protein [Planctomycetaceae bacterium]